MSRARGGKWSRRQRRIALALSATLAGSGALTALALWVQRSRETDLADPTAGVSARSLERAGVALPPIRFRDVAREAGIEFRHGPGPRRRTLPEDTGSGVAWGDVDGDGDDDLYAVSFPSTREGAPAGEGRNHLWRNDGGRFRDITERAGVADPSGFGMGASFADYDGDGDLDLHVTNFGPNRLYRNRGDGTFEEVAEAAGVADPLWSTGAAWGDYDRDGDLDLYVTSYVEYDIEGLDPEILRPTDFGAYRVPFTLNPNSFDPVPNRLYRNRGDGTFEEVAERLGVADPDGRGLAAVFCDLDGDGWLDLYVNNDVSPNRLWRNLGGSAAGGESERFLDISSITGTADPRGSMGLAVGEIGDLTGRPDGLPDLFITHWVAQENALYQSLSLGPGDLEYRDKTRFCSLGEISVERVGWGAAMVDLDLDGKVDIAVANGSTLEETNDPSRLQAEPMFLFWNDGRRFWNVAPEAGEATRKPRCARGLAAADYDGDGDVDLAVSVNRGPLLLLRNDTETAHRSLAVRLRGPAAACFGARVEVLASGRRQYRWWGVSATYLGSNGRDCLFGLGDAERAERVEVRWADGEVTRREGVAAGRVEIAHP